jgi:hypothetical protein
MEKPDDPGYATERSGVNKEELHAEMMDRHAYAQDYWREQYQKAKDDMEFAFLPDNQWDEWMKTSRKGRPMYTVNKLRQAMKQITNDQRQNRPSPKVRAVEDSDSELAEIRQGLIRNIDSTSDADRARDTAFLWAVGGGLGWWRVTTDYEDDGGFDQVIKKEEIADPTAVLVDPSAKNKDRRDAQFLFYDTTYSRIAFKEQWPKAEMISVKGTTDLTKDWFAEKEVIVSEYWYKKSKDVEIVLLSNGKVYDADDLETLWDELAEAGVTVQRRRMVQRETVYQCIVSGAEILEGPNEWPGKFIPFVPAWGEILRINGKDHFCGAVRFGKDSQRMYNYERSAMIEMVADQGYSPYMATPAMLEGQEQQWQSMRTKRPPALLYTPDPSAPGGAPQRLNTPEFPVALANLASLSSDDIKASTGIYDASLGARSNETSGRAIMARQREGDVANFDFIDNLNFAIKYDFEITNDLISKIYDTERQIRIIGDDGAEKVIRVNQPIQDRQTGQWFTPVDLTQGRYDISVTVGPSYTTQRMEAAEAFQQLSNDPSPIGAIMKFGFLKNLDLPNTDEEIKAVRKMLVAQGLLEPGEGDQPPVPPQLNPKDIADAQKAEADAQKSQQQATLYAQQAEGQAITNNVAAFKFGMESGAFMQPMEYYGQAAMPVPNIPAPGGYPG